MDPDAPPAETNALYESARASCRQGEFERGIELAQQALAIDPKQGRAHNLVGLALSRLGGRPRRSQVSMRRSPASPHSSMRMAAAPMSLLNWGAPKRRLHPTTARSRWRRIRLRTGAIAAPPCRNSRRRSQEALASDERSLACDPAQLQVHFNRGNALSALARYPEALAAYEAALALAPDYVEAVYNRACLLAKLRRYIEAMGCFEQVLALAPDHPRAVGELLSCTQMICDWDRAEQLVEKLRASVTDGHSIIPPHTLLGLGVAPADLLACNKRFAAQKFPEPAFIVEHRPGLRPGSCGSPICPASSGRIRFPIRSRNRSSDTIARGSRSSAFRRGRMTAATPALASWGLFDRVLDVTMLNDRDAAKLLRDLDIDILVDLTGPTENSRTVFLAHCPGADPGAPAISRSVQPWAYFC